MTRHLRRRAAPIAFALLCWSLPSAAQDEEPASLFIDRVDVNVVNVEVWVTDRDGRHVGGLGPDDFEILEDGEAVEISNFYAVARGDRVLRELEEDRAYLEGRKARLADTPHPEDQKLNLVVYVDHFNIRPQNRKRVLNDLDGFLEDRMAQGDRVMLVGYDSSLEVVRALTHDRQAIRSGILEMGKVATHRPIDDTELRRTMRLMQPTFGQQVSAGDNLSNAYHYLRGYVEETRQELRAATRALESTVRSLSGLPGRKALLYVSDGLPQRPGEELYTLLNDIFGSSGLGGVTVPGGGDPFLESLREDESHLFEKIIREANAHQVTFYTLDARGSGGAALSAEYREMTPAPGGHLVLDALREQNLQQPLVNMAASTGGKTILNTFNFENAFADMAQDFDSFYSLGYSSRRGGDGKYHTIEVRVTRPGLKVRHREGFVDKPEVERVADRTVSSLIFDMQANPLGIEVDFGEPEKQGRGRFLLPMLVRIPYSEVTLLPNGEVHEGRLKIFLIVQDAEGGISDLHQIPYPLEVPSGMVSQAQGKEIGYSVSLKVRKGTPKVAVGVWDELSGTESYVHKSVAVGPAGKQSPAAGS